MSRRAHSRRPDREAHLFLIGFAAFLRATAFYFWRPLKILFVELLSSARFYRRVFKGAYWLSFGVLTPWVFAIFVLLEYRDDIIDDDGSIENELMADPLAAEPFILFAVMLLNLLLVLPSALHRWASGRASIFDLPALLNFALGAFAMYLAALLGVLALIEALETNDGAHWELLIGVIGLAALFLAAVATLHIAFLTVRGAEFFRRKSRLSIVAYYGLALFGLVLSVTLIYPWDCPYRIIDWPGIETFCSGLTDFVGWPPPAE